MNAKRAKTLRAIPRTVVVLLFSLFSFLPFYIMMTMGTHKNEDLYGGLQLLPGSYLLENFKTIMQTDYFTYYLNSIVVAVSATVGGVLVSALAGYAFAKFQFRFKNQLFMLVLGTLMIPSQLGLVGFVMEMKWFHMINTLLPLILPPMASAFGVYWMRQYIEGSVPNEIIESAKMDGCHDFGIFARIVLPVIKPALTTIFLLLFLWSWNNYLTPLVVLNRESLYTIPLGAALLGNVYRTDYAARILALAVATVPILIMFSFGSRSLIRGLVGGSVKG